MRDAMHARQALGLLSCILHSPPLFFLDEESRSRDSLASTEVAVWSRLAMWRSGLYLGLQAWA